MSTTPLLKHNGVVTYVPAEKTPLLSEVFEAKQSDACFVPPHICFPESKLSGFAFRSKEVLSYLLELDPYGGTDPNGMFPLFFLLNQHRFWRRSYPLFFES